MLGEMLFYFYLFFNTLHRHCSLQSDKQVTHIPSIPSISSKQCSHLTDGGGSGGLVCQLKQKANKDHRESSIVSYIRALSDLFPLSFFFFLVHCCDDQVCMPTLAQGAEVSMGKPEHISTGTDKKRKQFCLPGFILTTMHESMTLKLEVMRAAGEFLYKAETLRKE